jgi:hypothetical protein
VNQLHKVASWEDLGQWCWERMLDLKRAWQTALPFQRDLPSVELEQSVDGCIRFMLCNPTDFLATREEDKPWILARLQFGSGLLQPRNLELLGIPHLSDPADSLRFLLLEEWYGSGREFWPLVCRAIAESNGPQSCEPSLLASGIDCC